jgi:hypothetical protein
LDVLKWLLLVKCPWDSRTCTAAALSGDLEILKWLNQKGCVWAEDTCASAAFGGHLVVLKWLRSKGCPWNEQTALDAAREGHLDVFEWALGNGAPDGVWGDEDENDPVEEWYVGGTAEKPPVNREEDEDEESLGDGMETQTSPAATPLKPKHNNTPTPKFTTPWSGGSAKKSPVLSPVKTYKRRTPVGTPGSAKRKTIGGCDEETPCKNQKNARKSDDAGGDDPGRTRAVFETRRAELAVLRDGDAGEKAVPETQERRRGGDDDAY